MSDNIYTRSQGFSFSPERSAISSNFELNDSGIPKHREAYLLLFILLCYF